MFDVGFAELLIVGIIALVVVGPERLPGLMRTLGLWVGRARASFASIREEVEREARLESLRDTERAIRDGMTQTQQELHRTADDVRSAVSDHGDSPDTGTADPVADDTAGATDRVTEPREPGAEEGANDDVASAGEGRRT